MPIRVNRRPPNPRGRNLVAGRTLYVCRRIPTGADSFMAPGTVFDAASVSEQRLDMLFRGRFIGHELPYSVRPVDAPAQPPAQSVASREVAPASASIEPPPAPKPARAARPTTRG